MEQQNKESNAPDRNKLFNRLGVLKTERSSFFKRWQELSSYFLPYNGRYYSSDRNNDKSFNAIYDNTGTRALRILGAGMMAGATSPARPWFRIKTIDEELNNFHSVKIWLDVVAKIMYAVFQKSNTYRSLHQIYEEIGCFGTAVSLPFPDFNTVIFHYMLTAGEYYIAADFKGQVCTLYREFECTVASAVKEFGIDNCSNTIKRLYNSGNLDAWVKIIHVVEPREDRDTSKKNNKNMPWGSYYFEADTDENKCLRESGFDLFPVLAPRWSVIGSDVYGNSPGMESLGDVKQLQHEQLRKGQCIDYQTKPPLQVPIGMKNQPISTLPGGTSYYDPSSGSSGGIKSLYEVNINLQYLLEDIRDVRERIRSSFYADLFLMLANAADTRMTATEVAERHEEKMLMLGPVLERLHNELLTPLIEITFSRMLNAGIIPTPPDELQGMELSIEFVSMLAQAQRAIAVNSIDRWSGNMGAIAAFKPDVLDKFDSDYWAEAYADMLGVDPKLIVADDKVALVRSERAQQQQAAAQSEMINQASQTAKNLSDSTINQDNVLGNVMDQFSGYNNPGVLR